MKYLTAIVIVLLAGCYLTVPTGIDTYKVSATVHERDTVVSELSLEALAGVAFASERSYGAHTPHSVWLALEVNHGESPATRLVGESIYVNDRVAVPEMTPILGSATDIEPDGADLIVRMTVSSA